jgi:hypothetical protein
LADRPARAGRSPFNAISRAAGSATLFGFARRVVRPSQRFSGPMRVMACSQAIRTHVPLSLAPPATMSVFATVVADPPLFLGGLGPIVIELRLLGFDPAGQPLPWIGAASLKLGYERPHRFTIRCCPGLVSSLGFSRRAAPAVHFWRPIRSWASPPSRALARCATASGSRLKVTSPRPRLRGLDR